MPVIQSTINPQTKAPLGRQSKNKSLLTLGGVFYEKRHIQFLDDALSLTSIKLIK